MTTAIRRRAGEVRQSGEGAEGGWYVRSAGSGLTRLAMAGMLALGLAAPAAFAADAAPPASDTVKHACPPPTRPFTGEMLEEARKHAADHGFLWRITRDGRSSYLYGTLHMGRPEWVVPGPMTMEALRATDTIALEMDLMDPEIIAQLKQAMATVQGAKLPAVLQARIRKDAEALCVPYDNLPALAPEMQVAALEVAAGRTAGLDAAYAVDGVLAGIGHGAKRNMVSLETPAFQMHMLLMDSPADTVSYVEGSLDDLESRDALRQLKRLAQVWADSDYAAMDRYPEWCECQRTPIERKLMKRLLDERNPQMAARIDALHRAGHRVFAAVGSLHMFGTDGLPALLEKKGYTVERITFSPPAVAH